MNNVTLMGRLTRDPDIRYTQGENSMAIARYTLAVDRRRRPQADGQPTADFIGCVAFGKGAEFAEKWLRKGLKIAIRGHIQTGQYQDKDGNTRYTTDVIVDEHEFAEKREDAPQGGMQQGYQNAPRQQQMQQAPQNYGQQMAQPTQGGGFAQASFTGDDGFMNIPDGIDEELPFQ